MNSLSKQVEAINTLNNYRIEFGILMEDEYRYVEVDVLNTDDTITKVTMQLNEVMYLTEHGTMTIPSRPILEHILRWVSNELDRVIDEIFLGVFEHDWDEHRIDERMREFEVFVNYNIKIIAQNMIQSNSTLSSILDVEDENKYLYDLSKLSKYIKCRIFRQ